MIATSSVLTFEMILIPSARFVWFILLLFGWAAGGVDDNGRTMKIKIKIKIKLIITLKVKAAAKVRYVDK